MRGTVIVVTCLLATASAEFCISGVGTPGTPTPHILFADPLGPGQAAPYSTRLLADSFESGRTVVLVGRLGMCRAVTHGRTTYRDFNYGALAATVIVGNEKCVKESVIAVVGVEPHAVRLIRPVIDRSPLPKAVIVKARRIAQREQTPLAKFAHKDGVPHTPTVMRVGSVALLLFGRSDSPATPAVFMLDDNIVGLEGESIYQPVFFSVQDRLHLAYRASYALSSRDYLKAYDLSGGMPQMVYPSPVRRPTY